MNWKLPIGWINVQLGEILDSSIEKINPPFKNLQNYVGLEHIERNSGKIINFGNSEEIKSTKTVFRSGDLLYGKLRPNLNKVWVADRIGICSTDILVFLKSKNINNKFLLYRLLSNDYVSYASHITSGVELPRIDQKKINLFSISLPPLNEQYRIVAKIEELFTQLDAGIASLQAAQVRLGQYRKAVLKHAFEGKLTEAWRMAHLHEIEPASVLLDRIREERRKDKKFKELPPVDTEGLPELPKGWVWTRIDDIIEILTDYHSNGSYEKLRNNVKLFDEPNYAIIIRATNLEKKDYQNSLKFISESAYHFLAKSKLFGGEVIIGKIGNAGKVYWMPQLNKPFSLGMNLFLLRFKKGILNRYIYFHLLNPFSADEIDSKVKGVGNVTIDKKSVRSIHIGLPSYHEQLKIIESIEYHYSIIDNLELNLNYCFKKSESLRQSILKKAFEGRLVPQDPHDEPASLLLERIRQEKAAIEPKKRGRKKNEF